MKVLRRRVNAEGEAGHGDSPEGNGSVASARAGDNSASASRARGIRKPLLAAAALLVVAATALGALPGIVAVFALGPLIAYIADPDEIVPRHSITLSRRNVVLGACGVVVLGFLAQDQASGSSDLPVWVLTLALVVPLVVPLLLEQEPVRPAGALALTRRSLVLAAWALLIFIVVLYGGFAHLGMAVLLLALPPALAASRVWAARRGRIEWGLLRHPLRPELRAHLLQCLNQWLFVGLLAAAIGVGTVEIFRIGLSSSEFDALKVAMWAGLVLLAALALVPRRRVYVATNVVVLVLSVFLAAQLVRISSTPEDRVTLDFPLNGEWFVSAGGRSALLSHHYSWAPQRAALDLVQLAPDGRSYRGDRERLASYGAFGALLRAPADGRITAVADSYPDLPIGETDEDFLTGGYLIEDIGGRYVMMAHLKQGSARVGIGDHVRRGQPLARVGNSGNTDEPHLHLQVQNRPTFQRRPNFKYGDFEGFRTYPMVFRDVEQARDLRRGDVVRRDDSSG
jgi:Peptidase family M23